MLARIDDMRIHAGRFCLMLLKHHNNLYPPRSTVLFAILNRLSTGRITQYCLLVSEPNPLRPLRDLQYGLGEMVFGGVRHLEYMNIWCFNEPK